jgi:GT2 family glycosyltransferase
MTAAITTVIPTFRRPDLLRRAITSVLTQSYPDLEVLVVDDASGDSTAAVVAAIAESDSRVRYVCQPTNLGMMPNQASAVKMVRTPFFTILNDDDFLTPGFFSRAMEAFDKFPSAALFIGRLLYWDMEVPERTHTHFTLGRSGFYPAPTAFLEVLRTSQNHTWTSIMFRREVVDALGGVDESVGYAADLEFELRMMAHFPVVVSHEPCAIYCMSPSSGSFQDWLTPYLPSMRSILAKFSADDAIEPEMRRRMVALLKKVFRETTVSGAARALTLNQIAPALLAADALERDLGAPVVARAVRLAARKGLSGRAFRTGLRGVKVARRQLRRDPMVEGHLQFVTAVLAQLDQAASQDGDVTAVKCNPAEQVLRPQWVANARNRTGWPSTAKER